MLQDLRSKSQSFFIYVIFAVIILSFIFTFGVPTDACSPSNKVIVAEIGGKDIPEDILNSALRRSYATRISGGGRVSIPSDEDALLAAKREVLENMILVYMIAETAEEAGFRVSEEELAEYIVNWKMGNPDAPLYINVNTGGAFDRESYENTLDVYGISKADYEEYKKRELLARNYLTFLENSVVVPDSEIMRVYKERQLGYELSYVKLEKRHIEHLVEEPTDAEIDAFLAENKADIEAHKAKNAAKYAPKVKYKEIVVQKEGDVHEVFRGTETDAEKSAEDRFAVVKKAVLEDKVTFDEASAKFNESNSSLHRPDVDGEVKGELKAVTAMNNPASKPRLDALKELEPGGVAEFETNIHYGVIQLVERSEITEREIAADILKTDRYASKLDEIAQAVHDKATNEAGLQDALNAVLYPDEKKDEEKEDEAPGEEAPLTPPVTPVDVAEAPADAITTESGLASKVLQPGTGTVKPKATDTVKVHYSGWTTDGKMFDSSVERGEPTSFPLNGVIKGWTEGLQLMVEGEKRRFWIPVELAYNNQPGKPAGMLVFDVELLAIEEPEPTLVKASVNTAKYSPNRVDPMLAQLGIPPQWDRIDALVGTSPEMARAIITQGSAGALLPEVYKIKESRVIGAVKSEEELDLSKLDDERFTIRDQLRGAKTAALLGDWRAVLRLDHPLPDRQPYGAWIQRLYDKGQEKGRFVISANYFRPTSVGPEE